MATAPLGTDRTVPEQQYVRNPKVEAAPMNRETVLFNPANNKFCVLNVTAAFIWDTLERRNTVPDIAAALAGQFAHPDARLVELDVRRTLQELQNIECVQINEIETKGESS